jgi:sphingomyelin phosphodiesterase 2
MGDFNSQPFSIPIQILQSHAGLADSFFDTHPESNTHDNLSPEQGLSQAGMTCDSPLNTWSHGKPIPAEVTNRGGKRLDYIFYRQPAMARRRPLIWGMREGESSSSSGDRNGPDEADHLEEGQPIRESVQQAPQLRCHSSEVVLTDTVPGEAYSYSDHFGLFSTFVVDPPAPRSSGTEKETPSNRSSRETNANSFEPLLSKHDPSTSISSLTSAIPYSQASPTSGDGGEHLKSRIINSALRTLRLYSRISESTAKNHLRVFIAAVVALLGLTIGCAFQPKSWLQPIFTLLGGVLGAGGATMLYTGFIWGRWEMGLLTEVTEEMELELRIVEMEEKSGRG